MYEQETISFDPSEVVIKSSDESLAVDSFSEVSTDECLTELQAIHNELATIREISLLILVAFLLVFIFKFLFGQISAWFSA